MRRVGRRPKRRVLGWNYFTQVYEWILEDTLSSSGVAHEPERLILRALAIVVPCTVLKGTCLDV